MKTKPVLIAMVVVAVSAAIVMRPHTKAHTSAPTLAESTPPPVHSPSTFPVELPLSESPLASSQASTSEQVAASNLPPKIAIAPAPTLRPAFKPVAMGPVVPEPLARVALEAVGTDPNSTSVWIGAINDPNMTPHDRKNLIEDLNENGISDPQNPSQQDLPLIESRLALIDDLTPDAMDDVNVAAFAEARKDLVNMRNALIVH